MKHRTYMLLMLLLLALPLSAFDLFDTARVVTFDLEGSVTTYTDKYFEPNTRLGMTAEFKEELWSAKAQLRYLAQLNALEAQELSISLAAGPGTLKAGLFTHPWGSASTAHVVDVLQGRDLRFGLVDDLEAMKRPTWMALYVLYWTKSSLELILKPGFDPSYLTMSGRYSLVPEAYNTATIVEHNTHTLSDWEAGGRLRFSAGPLDLGVLYFNGHKSDPGFALTSLLPLNLDIVYTRQQLFGLETSLLLGPFTLAGEGAFVFSEDTDGDKSSLYNSNVVYLAELSYTNPASSLFAALAYQGKYILDFRTNLLDVDYQASYDGKAYENTFMLAFEIPMLAQRLTLRSALTYQVESEGYAVLLGVDYDLTDNLNLFAKSTFYGALGSKSSLYKSWDANDQVTVGMRAWF